MSVEITKNKIVSAESDVSKNTSTEKNYLLHGKAVSMADLADFTFESVVFQDGTQLKDITFAELVEAVWVEYEKN